jgi:hypothetical protein
MAQYQAPKVPATRYNMGGRVEELERTVAGFDSVIRDLKNKLDNLPKAEPPAAPAKGERGPKGDNGRDGKDGRDGVGLVGPVGPQGRAGKDCVCRTELAEQHVAGIETSLRDARAETISLKAQLTMLGVTVQGLLDVNKRTGEYIEWLRQRTAARIATAQGAKQHETTKQ